MSRKVWKTYKKMLTVFTSGEGDEEAVLDK